MPQLMLIRQVAALRGRTSYDSPNLRAFVLLRGGIAMSIKDPIVRDAVEMRLVFALIVLMVLLIVES